MKKPLTLEQYESDFKKVLLFFTCSTIHEFFNDDPKTMFQTLDEYRQTRRAFEENGTRVPKEQYFKLLKKMVYINNGVGLPFHFVKSMFHRSNGTQSSKKVLDEIVGNGELTRLPHGVLKTKVKTHFTVKYLLPLSVLDDFFADKDLAKIMLENRIRYWTKRQNRFIDKELDRRLKLKGQREVLAAKKQIEREETELEEQVNGVLDEMDI